MNNDEKWQLDSIPDEINTKSSLKWHNTKCTSMSPSLGLHQIYSILAFSRHTKSDQMEQFYAYRRNQMFPSPTSDTSCNREPHDPDGDAAAEMWHKATKCPSLKDVVGVTVERAFNAQLLNSDPYKHTGTDNLPEMYISCRAPGGLPRVQLHRDHLELRRKNSQATSCNTSLSLMSNLVWLACLCGWWRQGWLSRKERGLLWSVGFQRRWTLTVNEVRSSSLAPTCVSTRSRCAFRAQSRTEAHLQVQTCKAQRGGPVKGLCGLPYDIMNGRKR